MSAALLQNEYDALDREARQLAGGLTDLSQRATVYHRVFRESGRNHIFPLIAAHGALWAGGYFRFGLRLGHLLAWQFPHPRTRQVHRERLQQFADSIRDINRRVCIDSWVNLHFTQRFGKHPLATQFVPAVLLSALNQVHAANAARQTLSDDVRREIFTAHFLHEQTHVVGPSIEAAVAELRWPLLQALALKPIIRFAYFPAGRRLWFRNFARREERVANGLLAFDWGARVGWDRVEDALRDYRLLPRSFFANSDQHFTELKQRLLIAAS